MTECLQRILTGKPQKLSVFEETFSLRLMATLKMPAFDRVLNAAYYSSDFGINRGIWANVGIEY